MQLRKYWYYSIYPGIVLSLLVNSVWMVIWLLMATKSCSLCVYTYTYIQELSGTTNGTLVETDQDTTTLSSSNCYSINTAQSEGRGVAGGASPQGGVAEGCVARGRRRGIPVAPLKLEGENSLLSKAFTKVQKACHITALGMRHTSLYV